MNFRKDLLLIDLETTGLDSERHEIIQLAAILLDKKTLLEKEAFSTFVRPKKWQTRDRESMKINNISHSQVKEAPVLKEVVEEFSDLFDPSTLILSFYGGPVDMDFLRKAYKSVGIKWLFDYHFFNLWAVFFAHLAKKDKLKNSKKFAGFSLDDFMKEFKLKSKNRHDALEDCRIEAEVLRKILNRYE